MKDVLLKVENARAYYVLEQATVKAVDSVSFEIYEDEVVGIVGESGSGKTTLSNLVFMNMLKPLRLIDGKVFLKTDGKFEEISAMSRDEVKRRFWGSDITIIPQSAMNALMPTIRMSKYVEHLAQSHGIDEKELLKKAEERFEQVGLKPEWLRRYPFELSGGMRQRAVIAIATLLNPKLLVADEPTSALDVVNQKVLLQVLMDLKRKGIVKSIMFITHDIATIRQIADRMLVMYAGKIVEFSNMEKMLEKPLHPYTKGLFESVLTPEPEVRERGISVIPGAPANLINPPSGCRFQPRCPHAMEICKQKEPKLIEVEKDRQVACFLFQEERV
ncbi:MAG: ABC transporter ATP-binding protein [Fervidobacterium sp.]|uniref:Peptide/nickel transport system ATP-binding protein n=1 Tax=Fervidobacterium gondwanense DSM 13020 TaxID=1121883 RepID=A0A1M7T0G9_FERGO|nr:ABC transporter ATP-binding protein [Fervidobacterium gondwanense]UXF01118.1 peptide ABC transporter ATPase [Fervidobacterium riparium]SHN64253.1 peptide/nickel transport system ATP-binding protein [Fervidobacterium gondwanense DSM 13020]